MKITDFKIQFKDIDSAMRAAKMFELRKQYSVSVMDGKFKDAIHYRRELARNAVEDFDTYKQLPFLHFTLPGIPLKSLLAMSFNNFKYKIFSKFCKKTPDEKKFNQLSKEYFSKLTKEDIQKRTIDITIPSLF